MTNQFVAMKIPRPVTVPVTTPWTVAFSRMSRVSTRFSSAFLSFVIRSAPLDELEKSPEEIDVRATAEHRHPEEEAGISQEREAPAAHETDDEAIGESHDGAGPGYFVAGEVLAKQAQGGADEGAASQHHEERRQRKHKPGGGADREPEGDAVELDEDLGQPKLEDSREVFGRDIGAHQELLVVLLLGVDAPQIVLLIEQEIPGRQHPGQHGMVLVVVAMQPVAADGLQVFEPIDERPNGGQAIAVAGIVDRICFFVPEHAPILDVGSAGQPDLLELPLAQLDEIGIRHAPERIVLGTEVLQAEAGLAGVRYHVGTPVLEVLDAADPDLRGVDVDPVVREEGWLSHDQTDGEKVPVDELCRGGADLRRRRGRELRDEFSDGHARDEVGALDQLLPPGHADDDAVDPAAGSPHAHDLVAEPKHGLVPLDLRGDRFPP